MQPVDVARFYYAHFKYTRAHESWRHHARKGFQGASLVTGIKQKPLLTKISTGEFECRVCVCAANAMFCWGRCVFFDPIHAPIATPAALGSSKSYLSRLRQKRASNAA